jgi:septal ring factor EnvC (AmiA/AmiB activator)
MMMTQREIEVLAGEAKELERKLGMEREERERLEGVVRDRERRLNELQSSVEAERSSNSLLARGGGGGVSLEESLRERLIAEERERERAEQELRTLRREREAEAGSPVPKMGLLTEATSAVVRGSPVKEGGSDPEGLRNLVAQWEVLTPESRDLNLEKSRILNPES